jgi:hypothetical protein
MTKGLEVRSPSTKDKAIPERKAQSAKYSRLQIWSITILDLLMV